MCRHWGGGRKRLEYTFAEFDETISSTFTATQMREFNFLNTFIEHLSFQERFDPWLGYSLDPGRSRAEIVKQASEAGITIPNELGEFYEYSYGAMLGEYHLLTIPEITDLITRLKNVYEENWKESILPFAYVQGVGDVVAFDLAKLNDERTALVLDGFHELPPARWEGICYGLRVWLEEMTKSGFQPFWLDTNTGAAIKY